MTDGYDMEATLRLRNNALREAKAEIASLREDMSIRDRNQDHYAREIASLRDQFGEALVRENNLIAALERALYIIDNNPNAFISEVAIEIRKALANEEGK